MSAPEELEDFEARVRRHHGVAARDLAVIQAWGVELRKIWTPAHVSRAVAWVGSLARVSTLRGHRLLTTDKPDIHAWALARAKARALTLGELMLTDAWARSLVACAAFFRFAENGGLIGKSASPMRGIARPPLGGAILMTGPKQAGYYEAVLRSVGTPDPSRPTRFARLNAARDHAVCVLLAHGLGPSDVVGLRHADVDVERHEVTVRRRQVVITAQSMLVISHWITASPSTGGWLFPARGGRRAKVHMIASIVTRAARRTFPYKLQIAKRRAVHPNGFRDAFVRRVARSKLRAETCLILTRVSVGSLHKYAYGTPAANLARAHDALEQLARRWRRWI